MSRISAYARLNRPCISNVKNEALQMNLLLAYTVPRPNRKWSEDLSLVMLKSRIPQPAFWDKIFCLSPIFRIVEHGPVPHINVCLE